MSGVLEIVTLGGLAIRLDGVPLTGFASRKVEALLVFLACAGRPKAREVLAELLWEERSQSQALSNLRVALSSLRKQVAPFLMITRDAIGLTPGANLWFDAALLEDQLATIRDEKRRAGSGLVAEVKRAVALYLGDFLEGFYLRDSPGFENWIVLERERIRAVHEQLAQWLVDALAGRSRPRPAPARPVELQAPAADRTALDLLRQWTGRGREVLDLPSLAVVYASRRDLAIGPQEAGLLIRSALHHGVDVEPWLRRAGSPQAAVQALWETWERYPKPRVRGQVVSALAGLPGQEAGPAR